jgi:hypothetical protein
MLHLKRAENEGAEDYPDVITPLDDDRRLIRSRDPGPTTQWVVQKRHPRSDRPATWDGVLYFQDTTAMRDLYLHDIADPKVHAVLDSLPPTCPQRPLKRAGRAG